MTLAMFKLESFTAPQAGQATEMVYGQDAIDRAYAEGLASGLARKDDDELRNLGSGLERLGRALGDDAERRAALRNEAVAALAPILDAIVDSLAPADRSRQLEAALRDELSRLARMSSPLRARVACGQRLRELVEHCCAETGIEGVDLVDADSDRISLSLQGGRIDLSPEKIAQDIRALISELKEDDTSWTN